MTEKNYLADYAKSFNWAGFFLPKIIYNDCSKLYSFCRILDNVVDEGRDLKLKNRPDTQNFFIYPIVEGTNYTKSFSYKNL